MMDAVRKLILERTEERGTNLAELSRKIGKNHAYLQQFIKRGVPIDLPEKVRPALANALEVPEKMLKPQTTEGTLNQDRPAVERRIAETLTQVKVQGEGLSNPATKPGSELFGEADLPVFGTAQGGKGALIVTEHAVDWVVRPAPLLRVRDGYGMIVTGDSMAPAHRSGSTALVNPHLPPRPGDTCVFRKHEDDGTVTACIKELVRFTDDLWHVRQYNPKKTYSLKRSEWQVCHVTIGNYFGR
jgi:phage repressor protein C with HTH and peptisase S24 domain